MKRVRLNYFALLREQRGLSEEVVETTAATPRALYETLRAQHGFTLPAERIRVACNGDFSSWDSPLLDESTLVFIPPVAGG